MSCDIVENLCNPYSEGGRKYEETNFEYRIGAGFVPVPAARHGTGGGFATNGVIISQPAPYELSSVDVGEDEYYTTVGISELIDDEYVFTVALKVTFEPGFTVSFWDEHGTEYIPDQGILPGGTATEPAQPTAEGYMFGGWYADEDYTTKYDFSAAVTEDITLYAKWTQKSSGGSSSSNTKTETTQNEDGSTTTTTTNKSTGTVTETTKTADGVTGTVVTDKNGNVTARELFGGTSANTFTPGGFMTRQAMWMVLARMSGANPANMTEAKRWAEENGVSDGSDPTNAVTRQQFVTMLWRWAKSQGIDVSVGEDTNILSYNDAFSISEYAIPAMQWACGAGIMGGYADGTLRSNDTATRAHVAKMLMNFMA